MTKQRTQHIGDDQLVYGMPKHMVGGGAKQPVWPRPNSVLETRGATRAIRTEYLGGYLEDYEDHAFVDFYGLGKVTVKIKHIRGGASSGVWVRSNLDGERQCHTLGGEIVFTFGTLTDVNVYWRFDITQLGANKAVLQYTIEYEAYQ